MKTRLLSLVAGVALVAASAVGLQAAELKKTSMPDAFSSDAVNGVPSILGSLDNSDSYQAMSRKEMKSIQGEHVWQPAYSVTLRCWLLLFVAPSVFPHFLPPIVIP